MTSTTARVFVLDPIAAGMEIDNHGIDFAELDAAAWLYFGQANLQAMLDSAATCSVEQMGRSQLTAFMSIEFAKRGIPLPARGDVIVLSFEKFQATGYWNALLKWQAFLGFTMLNMDHMTTLV